MKSNTTKKQTATQAEFLTEEDAIAANREQLQQLFPLPDFSTFHQSPYQQNASAINIKRNIKKALPLLTLFFLAIFLLAWIDPTYKTQKIASAIGEHKTLTLADNSQLTLDTNTQLQVDWHLRSRQITLHSGRAMFHITRQQYRPFYVQAGDAQVKVVGTIFDVLRKNEQVTVTVLQGKVQVRGYNQVRTQYQQTYLTKNEQVTVNQGEISPTLTVDSALKTAWKDGKIIFERTPLNQAVAEMQRYKTTPIVLTHAQLANLKISGTFNTNSSDDIIQLLPNILPVKVSHDANGTIYIGAK